MTVGKVALCVAKGAHGVVFDNLRNGTGWQQRPAELKRGQLNAGQPAPPPPPPPKVTHSQSLKLLSRMLGGSVCGQAAKCAWRLFPRVRAHTHTPTPTHTNTHKHKHTRIRDGLGVASGACLRPPSSRSPERGPSGAGGLQSGSKTVTPEYGVERGRECVQTRACLAHCTDELPLASPRCARVPRRKRSSPGA